MMILSYKLGQKHYPVPYAVKKLSAYLLISILLYVIHIGMVKLISASYLFSISSGLVLIWAFAWFISKIERKELSRMPVIGKYFRAV